MNEIQITDYVYAAIRVNLEKKISGKVYHNGCRPTDSNKEDAVIVYSAANAQQIQEGVVYLNIFCKDLDNGGGMVLNRTRLKAIAAYEDGIISDLKAHGTMSWNADPDNATSIFAEPQTKEHFVSFKLRFKILTNR